MLAALRQLVLACGLSAMIGAQLALAKYVPLAPPGMGAQGVPGGQGGQGGKLGWGKWGHQGKLGKLGGLGGLERRGGQGRPGGGTGRQLRMRATVERGKRGKTVRPNDNIRISPSILSPSAGAVCIHIRIHDTYTYHVFTCTRIRGGDKVTPCCCWCVGFIPLSSQSVCFFLFRLLVLCIYTGGRGGGRGGWD